MHAIVCMSLLHIQSLQLKSTFEVSKTVIYHWQQCLLLYSKVLGTSIRNDKADAMLVTSSLISGIAFIMTDAARPELSWPMTDSPFDLQWLSVQTGIMLLLQAVQPLDNSSRVQMLFAYDESTDFDGNPLQNTCDQHYLDLRIRIGEGHDPENQYERALQILAPLSQMPCTADTVFTHLGFIASIDDEFISLLRKKDHKALLILAYWYAKMCSFDCWWIAVRSKLECTAICMYLKMHATSDIVTALRYPSQACGFQFSETAQAPAIVPCMTM